MYLDIGMITICQCWMAVLITGIQIRGEKQGMHSKQRTWRRGAGEGPDLGAAGSRRGRGGGAATSRRGRGGWPGQASRRGRGEQGDRRGRRVELPSGVPSQEERTSGSGRAGCERLSATWKARIERERTFSLFSFLRASFPVPDVISARALPRRPKISPVSGSSAYTPPCAPARRGIAAEAPICAA